jgi:hypothetical protein
MNKILIRYGEQFRYVNDVFEKIPSKRKTCQSTWGKAKYINATDDDAFFVCIGKGTSLKPSRTHHTNDYISNKKLIIEGEVGNDYDWTLDMSNKKINEIRAYFTTDKGTPPYIFRGVYKILKVDNYEGYKHKVRIWELISDDLFIDDKNDIISSIEKIKSF